MRSCRGTAQRYSFALQLCIDSGNYFYELEIASGHTLRLRRGFDSQDVQTLIAALGDDALIPVALMEAWKTGEVDLGLVVPWFFREQATSVAHALF